MAAVTLDIDVEGLGIADGLTRFASLVQDFTPAWEKVGEDFKRTVNEQFTTEGGRGGTRWKPLAPSTIRQKGAGGSILVRTGALRSSVTGGPGYIKSISARRTTFGTSDRKAVFHQFGTSRMPARPIIVVTKEDKTRWRKEVQRWMVSVARSAGLLSYSGGGS